MHRQFPKFYVVLVNCVVIRNWKGIYGFLWMLLVNPSVKRNWKGSYPMNEKWSNAWLMLKGLMFFELIIWQTDHLWRDCRHGKLWLWGVLKLQDCNKLRIYEKHLMWERLSPRGSGDGGSRWKLPCFALGQRGTTMHSGDA